MKYKVFGAKLHGPQPTEAAEMATFFNSLRNEYPDIHCVALHIRNEGVRSYGKMQWEKTQGGFVKGASDILIPGSPTFVCELKSRSIKSKISKEQEAYLNNCAALGCFACLAYGWEAALEAVKAWLAR